MSVNVNYEEVAKELALKVANLEFQVTSYKNLADNLQKELDSRDTEPQDFPPAQEGDLVE